MFNHGYIPPAQYRTTERYVAYVDGFARNGYVVFKPDYRGHGDSEGTHRRIRLAGVHRRRPQRRGVAEGVPGGRSRPHRDVGPLDGRLDHAADDGDHKDIKAGVIWAGVVASLPDLLERWHRRGVDRAGPTPGTGTDAAPRRHVESMPRRGGWRDQLTSVYGSPAQNPAFWASISPNAYLADVSGPIQLHHGTGDATVPYEFSETLKGEGGGRRPGELHTYPGDDHNLSGSFGTAMQRSVAFFDRYVKNTTRQGYRHVAVAGKNTE